MCNAGQIKFLNTVGRDIGIPGTPGMWSDQLAHLFEHFLLVFVQLLILDFPLAELTLQLLDVLAE